MTTDAAQADAETFYLKDYTPFGFEVDSVALTFRLAPHATRVLSQIRFTPKPGAADPQFFLHGEQLKLISAKIDGAAVTPEVTPQGLTCSVPQTPFLWEAEVEIDPAGNTALEGLYMSGMCRTGGHHRMGPPIPPSCVRLDIFCLKAMTSRLRQPT